MIYAYPTKTGRNITTHKPEERKPGNQERMPKKETKDKREQIITPLKKHESDIEKNNGRPVDNLVECV